jgi:NADPH:quinone reductase-like Zn-dependent oxidoreductase
MVTAQHKKMGPCHSGSVPTLYLNLYREPDFSEVVKGILQQEGGLGADLDHIGAKYMGPPNMNSLAYKVGWFIIGGLQRASRAETEPGR